MLSAIRLAVTDFALPQMLGTVSLQQLPAHEPHWQLGEEQRRRALGHVLTLVTLHAMHQLVVLTYQYLVSNEPLVV